MSDSNRSTIAIAVTGGIACGKSEVGRMLGEFRFKVCDADHVAHELMVKGSPLHEAVVEHFGRGILTEDGEISRRILGKMVFSDLANRRLLNQLVHPEIRLKLGRWIHEQRSIGENCAVLVPLLFESGMQDLGWDAVLCVSSGEADVLQRLEQRGLSREEAYQRMGAQMPLEEKERRSDLVIRNTGTLKELEMAVRKVVSVWLGERQI